MASKELTACKMRYGFKRKLKKLKFKAKEVVYVLKNRDVILEYQKRDSKYNLESEPPVDENINLQCVWATEIYSTMNFEILIQSFEKLGWDNDSVTSWNNPVTWIRQQRQTAFRGAIFNLGIITRPENENRFPPSRKAVLPDFVDHAQASMHSLSKSAISISVCFVIKDEFKNIYEEILRKQYKTYIQGSNSRGFAFINPHHQKDASVVSIRKRIREEIKQWFSIHLPGLFVSGLMTNEFPSCEHITLKQTTPYSKDNENADRAWLHSLGVYDSTYVWRSDDFPKLKLLWPYSIDNDIRFHAIFISDENFIDKSELEKQGYKDKYSKARFLDDNIGSSVVNKIAILSMFSGFERYLNEVRDSMPRKHPTLKQCLSIARFISNHVLASLNISVLSEEFENIKDDKFFNNKTINSFKIDPDFRQLKINVTLLDSLNDSICNRIKWLGRLDTLVRELLGQYSSAVSTFENIKLQRNMKVLTIFIFILTIITTMLAMKQDSTIWDYFKEIMAYLWALIDGPRVFLDTNLAV